MTVSKPTKRSSGLVSFASAQGEREHQEDRLVHALTSFGWLLAAFDGHGGAATAELASEKLRALFDTHLQTQRGRVPATLKEVFRSLNQLTEGHASGSTASIVFIPHDAQHVYLAILGDSPVAILDAGGKIHIGPEHNVRTNLRERAAAEARGGAYREGYLEDAEAPNTGLQMARSLGDAALARVLNREPEIETALLGGKGIVLVGSDGLLLPDGTSNAGQLTRLMKMIREGADAEVLVQDALSRRTGDNVSAIVWRKD